MLHLKLNLAQPPSFVEQRIFSSVECSPFRGLRAAGEKREGRGPDGTAWVGGVEMMAKRGEDCWAGYFPTYVGAQEEMREVNEMRWLEMR